MNSQTFTFAFVQLIAMIYCAMASQQCKYLNSFFKKLIFKIIFLKIDEHSENEFTTPFTPRLG